MVPTFLGILNGGVSAVIVTLVILTWYLVERIESSTRSSTRGIGEVFHKYFVKHSEKEELKSQSIKRDERLLASWKKRIDAEIARREKQLKTISPKSAEYLKCHHILMNLRSARQKGTAVAARKLNDLEIELNTIDADQEPLVTAWEGRVILECIESQALEEISNLDEMEQGVLRAIFQAFEEETRYEFVSEIKIDLDGQKAILREIQERSGLFVYCHNRLLTYPEFMQIFDRVKAFVRKRKIRIEIIKMMKIIKLEKHLMGSFAQTFEVEWKVEELRNEYFSGDTYQNGIGSLSFDALS